MTGVTSYPTLLIYAHRLHCTFHKNLNTVAYLLSSTILIPLVVIFTFTIRVARVEIVQKTSVLEPMPVNGDSKPQTTVCFSYIRLTSLWGFRPGATPDHNRLTAFLLTKRL